MLNDWQFSIVNGHYCKDILFKNRSKTISQTIVNSLINKCLHLTNIVTTQEKYYEFINTEGKVINSDIDFAMYDTSSNTMLVVECKWKDNHYIANDYRKNYIKIQDSLNKIYSEQMSRHEEFLSQHNDNIKSVFKYDERIGSLNSRDIFYLAVDKRSALHIDNKHLLSVYALQYLIDKYTENNNLNLNNLITEIKGLRTYVDYQHTDNVVKYVINDDITILSDDLIIEY